MASKLQDYIQMAGQTAAQVTKNYENWTGFLTTASRLYKYPFPEQLMIYAQRPQATACAEYDIWSQRMRRYVRRGSKGIALVNVRNGRPSLRYVFDVADTGRKKDSCNLYLWQYKEEYHDIITKALEERFGVPGTNGLVGQLERIAARLAKDYWDNHHKDIMYEIGGSLLEELEEFSLCVEFCKAVAVSIAYILITRCGLEPEQHFSLDDFRDICDFNTQPLVKILGAAVNQASRQVLRR